MTKAWSSNLAALSSRVQNSAGLSDILFCRLLSNIWAHNLPLKRPSLSLFWEERERVYVVGLCGSHTLGSVRAGGCCTGAAGGCCSWGRETGVVRKAGVPVKSWLRGLTPSQSSVSSPCPSHPELPWKRRFLRRDLSPPPTCRDGTVWDGGWGIGLLSLGVW